MEVVIGSNPLYSSNANSPYEIASPDAESDRDEKNQKVND